MAIRLITGRLQQRSRYCAKQQQFWTQAQLTRSDSLHLIFLETSMSWAWSFSGVLCRYLREEGESAYLCLVSALVSQPVLWCSVMWRFMLSVTRSDNHLY